MDKDRILGNYMGSAAYLMWGFLALYWKLIIQVPANEILAHRIIWSLGFIVAILLYKKDWKLSLPGFFKTGMTGVPERG